MKILTIGKKNHLFWIDNINLALHTKHYIVDTLYLNELNLLDYVHKNLLKFVSHDLMYTKVQHIIEKKIMSFQPDLIIVVSPFMFHYKIFDCF